METALSRFYRYIAVETTSSMETGVRPSTPGQRVLAAMLKEEMEKIRLQDVHIWPADNAVIGTIPANTTKKVPTLGFLAHMDTADAASGKNVTPHIVKNYDGGRIYLNDTVYMEPGPGFSALSEVVGEDLVVTDGTTLLGADDKAGIAEIMTMAERLLNSNQPHGEIRVGFTTDEEIGAGPDLFDVKDFACDFAYTVDGGSLGELEYENFNAAFATVDVTGVGVHPGYAKNLMKNAAAIGAEFQMMLPKEQTPEHTDGYEGFIHLINMKGDVTETQMHYILRDHDSGKLEEKKHIMETAAAFINAKYGEGTMKLTLSDSYYNMIKMIEPHMHLIETAREAFLACGVEPRTVPIRGGTDGAVLSFNGLPCPNLSTGGYQFHGIYEFIPVRSLETMPEVLLKIVYSYARGGKEYV